MNEILPDSNRLSTQIIIPCNDLIETLDFFTQKLNFRLEMIMPADSPGVAVISGCGITLRLELIGANSNLNFPEAKQEFIISRNDDENAWKTGRAGMQYRDLIPSRLGGRFIASHIRIPTGGEVPDYVHYHKVRFQMIYCKTGWAKLVYEDQGEPFLFQTGDCVLQPPEIRHRVLEASDGLEVIEIGSPAIHETFREHKITLPTRQFLPERIFNGQKFVHHKASNAKQELQKDGFEFRDTGISEATNTLADVKVLRAKSKISITLFHQSEFCFLFILGGEMKIGDDLLKAGDCCVIPAETEFTLQANENLEMLQVLL